MPGDKAVGGHTIDAVQGSFGQSRACAVRFRVCRSLAVRVFQQIEASEVGKRGKGSEMEGGGRGEMREDYTYTECS